MIVVLLVVWCPIFVLGTCCTFKTNLWNLNACKCQLYLVMITIPSKGRKTHFWTKFAENLSLNLTVDNIFTLTYHSEINVQKMTPFKYRLVSLEDYYAIWPATGRQFSKRNDLWHEESTSVIAQPKQKRGIVLWRLVTLSLMWSEGQETRQFNPVSHR